MNNQNNMQRASNKPADLAMVAQQKMESLRSKFIEFVGEETFVKETAFAMQIFEKNPDLLRDLATMEGQTSFASSIMNIVHQEVTLNPAQKLAYLITRADRKGEPKRFCLDISYRGLLYLAKKDGAIKAHYENVVREGDIFEANNFDEKPIHKYDPFQANREKLKIIGAYCAVILPDGSWKTMSMGVSEIEKIRLCSPGGGSEYSPWKKWYDQMCIKTVIKRAAKFWNAGENSRLLRAIEYDNTEAGNGIDLKLTANQTAVRATNRFKQPSPNALNLDAGTPSENDEALSTGEQESEPEAKTKPEPVPKDDSALQDKVDYLNQLIEEHGFHDIKKNWFETRGIDSFSKLTREQIDACIDYIKKQIEIKENKA